MMQCIFGTYLQRLLSIGETYSAFCSEENRFGNILVVSWLCLLEMLVFSVLI